MRCCAGPRTCLLAAAFVALTVPFDTDACDQPVKLPVPKAGPRSSLFGGTIERNLVNLVEKNVLDDWAIKKGKVPAKNIKWVATLGNRSYGGPVISGGRIFIGTNNERPR